MIVLITYHEQKCPQLFLAVMTPRYIAFIPTKNCFGQTWAGIGNWHMSHWVNVWNFRGSFFSKFQHFHLFWEWLNCYFWIPHPKMHYHQFPRSPSRGWKRRIVVQTFNHNISENIWDRSLKFNIFTYLHSMYIHMFQIWLKSEKVGFRHVPLWCGISQNGYILIFKREFN